MKKLTEQKKKWIERMVENDRSYKLFLYNRMVLFILLVLGQVITFVVLIHLFIYNSSTGILLQLIIAILEIVFVIYLINQNERPFPRLHWILLILLTPVIGVPCYLWYGEGRGTRKMSKKISQAIEENERAWQEFFHSDTVLENSARGDGVCRFLSERAGYPLYTDGEVVYYKSGEEMFPQMLAELKKAEKFILLEYFIISSGKMWKAILKVLLEKAMQGVQVRIIYDDWGCMISLPPKYDQYLESLHKNIRCMTFNDVIPIFAVRMNNRDHRKILVIDGKVAFTGGINLADEYIAEKRRFGYWKDSGVKIVGDGAQSFTKMFFYIWNAFREDKEDLQKYLLPVKQQTNFTNPIRIQPYDDSPLDNISIGEGVYTDLINRANEYVYISTPYLILDDFMRAALCQAALRGVDVRIVTPGIPDKKLTYRLTRANYSILQSSGVKIYEYTPGFVHAKGMVCDDSRAVVGTINFDYRSLYLHFENAVYFADCSAVLDVKRDFEEMIALSRLCTEETHKRGWIGRLVDSFLRLFETMF